MTREDLQLTPIEEIVEELLARTEACVICYEMRKPDEDGVDVKGVWRADKTTEAIGLCEMVKRDILDWSRPDEEMEL